MDEHLEEAIRRIVEEVNPDKIILFGSRAKGAEKEQSDYDIFVLKSGITHRGEIEKRIYLKLFGIGVPVDVIVEVPDRFEELKDNPFLVYSEVAKYGKVVYEK